jgi:hypothetical protein
LLESSACDQANSCIVSDGSASKSAWMSGAVRPPVGGPKALVGGPNVSVDAAKPPVETPTIAAIVGTSTSWRCCSTGRREESTTAPTAVAISGCTAVTNDTFA